MNVFACDKDPLAAASQLADQHVIKMTLETAQLASTFCRDRLQVDAGFLYRPTHRHHPVQTCMQMDPAYLGWVMAHGRALGSEYMWRFGRSHKSSAVMHFAFGIIQDRVEVHPPSLRGAPKCVLPEHRHLPIVLAYRETLKTKYTRNFTGRWTLRGRPFWMGEDDDT